MNLEDIKTTLCKTLCADVSIVERQDNLLHVSTPFSFSDGDSYSIYLSPLSTGGFRITDKGATMMHLSYENDIDKFREGTRGKIFDQILAEMDLSEDNGEFYIDSQADQLGASIFRFGQGVTRIHDLTFLNRLRVESTFYEDLREKLRSYVNAENIHESYIVKSVPNATDYPVDYYIEGGSQPLYLFGVPNRDKARLATIILQHLNTAGLEFNSMVVFQNAGDVPSRDLSRLMNAANDMIASLDAESDFERKLLRRVK